MLRLGLNGLCLEPTWARLPETTAKPLSGSGCGSSLLSDPTVGDVYIGCEMK
jgi:hypothetical protein